MVHKKRPIQSYEWAFLIIQIKFDYFLFLKFFHVTLNNAL